MVAYLRILFYYLSFFSLLLIAIGLWRPWVMLWWEDVSNRRKVIKVYGSIGIIFLAIYWLLKFF